MRTKLLIDVVFSVGLMTGCGASSAARPSTDAVAASAAGFSSEDQCSLERVVLELAVAAHTFETGASTGSEAELIEARWIDRDLEGVAVIDGLVVPVADERCSEPPAAVAQLTPECFGAVFRLVTAAEAYQLHTGAAPSVLADLTGAGLVVDGALYDFKNTVIVPTEIGGCPPIETQSSVNQGLCLSERKTLEVASEAFLAQFGTLPNDESELVSAGLMRSEIENYDLVTSNGVIEIVAVSDQCAPFEETPDS